MPTEGSSRSRVRGGPSMRGRWPPSAARRRTACPTAAIAARAKPGTTQTRAPYRRRLRSCPCADRRRAEGFQDGKFGKQPAAFGTVANAARYDLVQRKSGKRLILECELALGNNRARNCLQQGRLAGAIGTENADEFSLVDLDRDRFDRQRLAVADAQVRYLKQRHARPPRPRYRPRRLSGL